MSLTRRVLILDDDGDVRKDVGCLLEEFGHEVVLAANPREALALCEKERFDVVLTDFNLPDMTGSEFARKSCNLDVLQRPGKVLLMTGNQEEGEKAERGGLFSQVLYKPYLTGLREAILT